MSEESPSVIIDELAQGFARHTIIPFIGSGLALAHTNFDWFGLRDHFNSLTGSQTLNPIEAAQIFQEAKGRESLIENLAHRLIVNDFYDAKGEAYLYLLGLKCQYTYTTNQDNVFEMACKKYGQRINVVHDLESLKKYNPAYPTLYKFHGDLSDPGTVIFTQSDYDKRMLLKLGIARYQELDIRLLSDALGKTLFFIGYSFSDPNIQEIFKHIFEVFKGKAPKAYLVAYDEDLNRESELNSMYGIRIVSLKRLYPSDSPTVALIRLLDVINKSSFKKQNSSFLKDLFYEGSPVVPVASHVSLSNAEHILSGNDSLSEKFDKIRGLFDVHVVPQDLTESVSKLYTGLIEQCMSEADISLLTGALFNLPSISHNYVIDVLAAAFFQINKIPISGDIFNTPYVRISSVPEDIHCIGFARGIERILEEKMQCNSTIQLIAGYFFKGEESIADFPNDIKDYVRSQLNAGLDKNQNPLESKPIFRSKNFTEILAQVTSLVPKHYRAPTG